MINTPQWAPFPPEPVAWLAPLLLVLPLYTHFRMTQLMVLMPKEPRLSSAQILSVLLWTECLCPPQTSYVEGLPQCDGHLGKRPLGGN